MSKKKPVHYVDNEKFYDEIVKHRKKWKEAEAEGKEPPGISNYLGECIYKMSRGLANKPCFMNYSYREEMISDGIENCIIYFNGYDPDYGKNPFAYFTQVIYYAFLRRIHKEEKNRYIVYKNFQESIIHSGHAGLMLDSDDNSLIPGQMYDNINAFIENFERRDAIKKEKRKSVKEGLTKFYDDDEVVTPTDKP